MRCNRAGHLRWFAPDCNFISSEITSSQWNSNTQDSHIRPNRQHAPVESESETSEVLNNEAEEFMQDDTHQWRVRVRRLESWTMKPRSSCNKMTRTSGKWEWDVWSLAQWSRGVHTRWLVIQRRRATCPSDTGSHSERKLNSNSWLVPFYLYNC